MRRLLAGPTCVGLLLLAMLWLFSRPGSFFVTPAHAQATPAAGDVMAELYKKVWPYRTRDFDQEVEITRYEAAFMVPFLPPLDQYTTKLPGKVGISALETFTISLYDRQTMQTLVFASTDGYDLAGKPYPGASPFPSASPTAAAGEPSPPAGELPSASPSVSPEVSAGMLYRYHPLTLLWPYAFKKPIPSVLNITGDELVYGASCWIVEQVLPDLTMRVWIDKDGYGVRQIEYLDPQDGQVVRAVYNTMYMLPEGELTTYKTALITKGDRQIIDVLVPNIPVFVAPPKATPTDAATGAGPKAPPSEITIPVVWTRTILFFVIVLLIGLAWFGGRYLLFLLARTRFSDELLLVENDSGPVARVLGQMGFTVNPCTMEVLTEERKFLGKKPGATLPRAVVIAPNAFANIKGYLFLLRAYVEEGGRVLVLTHNPSGIATMPFTPYFVPNMGEGKNVILARPTFWRRLKAEDVESKAHALLPKEFYVEINQKRPDIDVVQVYNQATGVRASAVCVVREGKGEYLLCQMLLVDELLKNNRPRSLARLMFADIIDYVQGRQDEKKAPAAAPAPPTAAAVPAVAAMPAELAREAAAARPPDEPVSLKDVAAAKAAAAAREAAAAKQAAAERGAMAADEVSAETGDASAKEPEASKEESPAAGGASTAATSPQEPQEVKPSP